MATVFLTYKLKPGIDPARFETWVRDRDYPAMRGIRRVASFVNHRVTGLLIGEGAPSYDYIEVFDIPDIAGFTTQDLPGPLVQAITGEFMNFAADPQFVVAEAVR